MMPNIQPAVPADYRSARLANTRWKTGSAPSIVSLRQQDPTAPPKVELDGISLSYKTTNGKPLLALDNIDLTVRAGDFLCIVGNQNTCHILCPAFEGGSRAFSRSGVYRTINPQMWKPDRMMREQEIRAIVKVPGVAGRSAESLYGPTLKFR